ncbi:hypothetical protein BDF19DRAFT_432816 [Syncephalis fuscata]|nr:hypothetical protein BDF19DRAFT_432816 [Syncephalis fuscata]
MTRYTKIGKKRHLEASGFQSQALIPRRNRTDNDGNDSTSYKNSTNNADRTEANRKRRIKQKQNSTICFACRKTGHSVNECPSATREGVGLCYKCGSKDHTTKSCRIKGDTYAFAQCFVCNEKGHLASKCPQNDRGVYPKGGCCRFCGSVRHLSKDCKPANAGQDGEYTLGTIDLEQGGDDDDSNKKAAEVATTNVVAKPKKKIVMF